jgi:hypothetical protein
MKHMQYYHDLMPIVASEPAYLIPSNMKSTLFVSEKRCTCKRRMTTDGKGNFFCKGCGRQVFEDVSHLSDLAKD